ncbi:substrate binding domain-containing protein [Celeribacter sp.]|uniref:substrate binding domain-containing protein n=1 Tax=Celeribacter sp. TaxID=1890673 RepID=UPI003A8DF19D
MPLRAISASVRPWARVLLVGPPGSALIAEISERLLDFVDDGVDLSFRVAPPEQPNLVTRTLLRYRHRLLAAPGYVAANPLPRAAAELKDHKTIGFGFHSSYEVNWSLSRQGRTDEIRFEPHLTINDYDAIRAAVLAGHGIGELPEPLCRDALLTGQLVEVLPEWSFPEIKLFAVHAGNASLSKLARLFLDTVIARLKR